MSYLPEVPHRGCSPVTTMAIRGDPRAVDYLLVPASTRCFSILAHILYMLRWTGRECLLPPTSESIGVAGLLVCPRRYMRLPSCLQAGWLLPESRSMPARIRGSTPVQPEATGGRFPAAAHANPSTAWRLIRRYPDGSMRAPE